MHHQCFHLVFVYATDDSFNFVVVSCVSAINLESFRLCEDSFIAFCQISLSYPEYTFLPSRV